MNRIVYTALMLDERARAGMKFLTADGTEFRTESVAWEPDYGDEPPAVQKYTGEVSIDAALHGDFDDLQQLDDDVPAFVRWSDGSCGMVFVVLKHPRAKWRKFQWRLRSRHAGRR